MKYVRVLLVILKKRGFNTWKEGNYYLNPKYLIDFWPVNKKEVCVALSK